MNRIPITRRMVTLFLGVLVLTLGLATMAIPSSASAHSSPSGSGASGPYGSHGHPSQPSQSGQQYSSGWYTWQMPAPPVGNGVTPQDFPQTYVGPGQLYPKTCGVWYQQDYYQGTSQQIASVLADGKLTWNSRTNQAEDSSIVKQWSFVNGGQCSKPTPSPTPTPTPTPSHSGSPTPSPTPSQTPSGTPMPSGTPSSSVTPSSPSSGTPTPSSTPTPSPTCSTGCPVAQQGVGQNVVCKNAYIDTVVHTVTVAKGDSCTLGPDAYVNGSIKSHGGRALYLYGSTVVGSITLDHVSGDVYLGDTGGCSYDPRIGGSILITGSHNVLICQTTVCKDLTLKHDNGRITVKASAVRRTLRILHNNRYRADAKDVGHRIPSRIHVIHTTWKHRVVRNNAPRQVKFS